MKEMGATQIQKTALVESTSRGNPQNNTFTVPKKLILISVMTVVGGPVNSGEGRRYYQHGIGSK